MGNLVKVGLRVRAPQDSEVLIKWTDTQFIGNQAEGGDREGITGIPDADGFAPILRKNPSDQNDLLRVWAPDAGDPVPRECVVIIHPKVEQNSTFATQPWSQRGHPRDTSGDGSLLWDGSSLTMNSGVFDPSDQLRDTIGQLIIDATAAKDAANQAAQDAATNTAAAIANLTAQVSTELAAVAPAIQDANQAAQDARDSADTKTYATDAEREAESPADGQWARTLRSTNDGWNFHRREGGAWMLKYEQDYSATSSAPLNMGGVIIPFYHYLADVFTDVEFAKLIAAMREYRRTQFLVVHNPASGPGTTADANIQVSINLIDGVNGNSLGYCDTSYGARSATDVKADYTQWNALYTSIDGVFLDQVGYAIGDTDQASKDAKRAYYKQLITDLYDAGAKYIVANAGSPLLAEWYGDGVFGNAIVIISEGSTMPSVADMTGFGSTHLYWPRNQRSILLHSQASQPDLSDALDYYGWLGVSDSANYDTLPSWFSDFCADVEGRHSGTVAPVGPQSSYLRQIQQTDDSNSADLPRYLIERDSAINNLTSALLLKDLNSTGAHTFGYQYSTDSPFYIGFQMRTTTQNYSGFAFEGYGHYQMMIVGGANERAEIFSNAAPTPPVSRPRGSRTAQPLRAGDGYTDKDGNRVIRSSTNKWVQRAILPFQLPRYPDVPSLPPAADHPNGIALVNIVPLGKSRRMRVEGGQWIHESDDGRPNILEAVPSNAVYIGQMVADPATEKFYVAFATGTPNDFKEIGGGGANILTFTTASFLRNGISSLDDVDDSGVITCTGILATDKIINVKHSGGDDAGIHVQARVVADNQVRIVHFGTGAGFLGGGNTTAQITVVR